jgi:predicted class III extradiol MEMO1 family dioxygenase
MVLWDPTGLSKEKLVLPLNYFFIVQHFDGEHSLEEIGSLYLKRFGEFFVPGKLDQLVSDLNEKLFLEGQQAEDARRLAQDAYRKSPLRRAAFAGRGYETDGPKLKKQIDGFFTSKEGPDFKPSENAGKRIKGLVVPTYDLKQAGPIYAWAYKELVPILSAFSSTSVGDPTVRESVDHFLTGFREILTESGRASCVIAAGDLAHLGMRYGDKAPPTDFSFHRCMQCDLEMLKPVEERQPEEFANYIRKEQDQRRISGFSPIYSLLRLIQAEKGQVLRYDRGITDQYNSTVTYASMAFF